MPEPRMPGGHDAIVAAARAEFSERGYGGASIRNIAARAGLSLSALYYYYKGKQDLLAAILDQDFGDYFAACDAALAQAGEGAASRLEALVTAIVTFRATHPAKSSVVASEGRSLAPEHVAAYEKRQEQATEQFRAIIEAGIAVGEFATPYPDDARRSIIAACNAVAQWYRPDGPLTIGDLVERYVTIALTIVQHTGQRPTARSS